MPDLLKQAFEKASELPEKEQDAFAALIIAELESEKRWRSSFEESGSQLEHLADEALEEYREGRTEPLLPGDG